MRKLIALPRPIARFEGPTRGRKWKGADGKGIGEGVKDGKMRG